MDETEFLIPVIKRKLRKNLKAIESNDKNNISDFTPSTKKMKISKDEKFFEVSLYDHSKSYFIE